MSNSTEQQQTQEEEKSIRISMEQAKELVKSGERLERLTKNRDFKALITDGYFTEEAKRLVLLRGSFVGVNEKALIGIDNDIAGIGSFYTYLAGITQAATQMRGEIKASERELVLMEQEAAERSGE